MRHLEAHLDDGAIHALLDGELDGETLAAVRMHVAGCESCAARLAEERLLRGEADRLIAGLDEDAVEQAPFVLPQAPDAPQVTGPPVVLVPGQEPSRWQRRKGPSRLVGIAATLAIASGAGFLYLNSRDPGTPVASEAAPTESDIATPTPEARGFELTDSGPALAVAESAAAETTLSPLDSARTLAANEAPAARDAFQPEPSGATAQRVREPELAAKATEPPPRADAEADAGAEARRPEVRRAEVAAVDQAAAREAAGERAPEAAPAVVQRAAPATVGAAAPPPAPRTPTVDERARIAMRIGLDEAQRMLGSAVHVIEGMRPELVGLIPGRLVRGANASEYVVRVVYQDEEGRLIFLDQQRLDATARQMGAQRDTIPPEWVVGETFLSLSGEIGREAIRALAARVR
jgi:anti-sigma factor RsiW